MKNIWIENLRKHAQILWKKWQQNLKLCNNMIENYQKRKLKKLAYKYMTKWMRKKLSKSFG